MLTTFKGFYCHLFPKSKKQALASEMYIISLFIASIFCPDHFISDSFFRSSERILVLSKLYNYFLGSYTISREQINVL